VKLSYFNTTVDELDPKFCVFICKSNSLQMHKCWALYVVCVDMHAFVARSLKVNVI